MKFLKLAFLGLGLSLSGLGFSYDFSKADALFAKRAEGADDNAKFESATLALKAYEAIYSHEKNLSEAETVYAFTQMNRLNLYRGGMLEGVSKNERKNALKSCIASTDDAIETLPGHEPHYFRLACLGLLGKISGPLERLKYVSVIKAEIPKALKQSTVDGKYVGGFEGGGILRVLAGVYSNLRAKIVHLYKPEEALSLVNIALETSGNIYRPFPETMTGKDYYDNYYYKGQSLIAVGMKTNAFDRVQEGYELLTSTLQTLNELIEAGELPKGREPETLFYKHLMEVIKKNIEDCRGSRWNSCLEDNLGKETSDEHDEL